MSLPQITKDQWKQFGEKEKWDIMVAMRGPDLVGRAATLKWVTTAPLRHVMLRVFRANIYTSALYNTDLNGIIVPLDSVVEIAPGFDTGHFLNHVIDAAQILHVPLLPIPSDAFVRGMKMGIRSALREWSCHNEEIKRHAEQVCSGNLGGIG